MADQSSTAPAATAATPASVEDPSSSLLDKYEPKVTLNRTLQKLEDENPKAFRPRQTFEELNLKPEILKGIYSMNFKKPSKVQGKSLPIMLTDPPSNMIAQSQSGTGKTAAFVTTLLSRVDFNQNVPQAIVLAPTRELARQIESVINSIGQFCTGLKVIAAVPGSVPEGEIIDANVVVGTPGTVMRLCTPDRERRLPIDPRHVRLLVLDEADNMLDQQGLGDQSIRVRRVLPQNLQVLLFSATFPSKVLRFAQKFAPDASSMTLEAQQLTVAGISQMFMDCPDEASKYDILLKLYGLMTIGSSVIFVKTRDSANKIKARMEEDGHKVSVLHGAKEGVERDTLINDFRSGVSKVLITTNVMARGIDVSTVSMVVNYDLPLKPDNSPDTETYLHRIGRTGRFGRVGVSISFIHDQRSFAAMEFIANKFGINLVPLSPEDWDATEGTIKRVIKSSRAAPDYNPDAEPTPEPATEPATEASTQAA